MSINSNEKLDFVLVGPEKTGTTSLVQLFRRNQIGLPEAETPIFENPDFKKIKNIDIEIEKLFENKKSKVRGIKRPSYASKDYFPERLYNYNKNIKIIFTIRDPYGRLKSHYLHLISFGLLPFWNLEKNFIKLIEKDQNFLNKNLRAKDILASQNYWENYINFRKYFPKESILILDIRDINKFSSQKEIDKFLGLKLKYESITVNVGSYDYISIFLKMLIHKIVLEKDENHRLHQRKTNFFEKVIVFFLYIILKLNFFKKEIKTEEKLKLKIQEMYTDCYKKILGLKI